VLEGEEVECFEGAEDVEDFETREEDVAKTSWNCGDVR